ncbi:Hypothetical protein NTJ_01511 [Nesidiocoris tenuis]|uniref:Uncharacterized protein n=1 Tax=Nesidiocoris tenuis TaxID=355587 RepID=A0ABN7A9P2_9HEMI|nr:Hypothetical protein NTJ_01511 [Nesidiocoris tenuis]
MGSGEDQKCRVKGEKRLDPHSSPQERGTRRGKSNESGKNMANKEKRRENFCSDIEGRLGAHHSGVDSVINYASLDHFLRLSFRGPYEFDSVDNFSIDNTSQALMQSSE